MEGEEGLGRVGACSFIAAGWMTNKVSQHAPAAGIVLFDLFRALVQRIADQGADAAGSPLAVIPGMALEIARLALGKFRPSMTACVL